MKEKAPQGNESDDKMKRIKTEVFFDAPKYIKLMEEKFPESLKLNEEGKITMNTIEGKGMLEDTKKRLGLSDEEMLIYFLFLAEEVERVLKKVEDYKNLN